MLKLKDISVSFGPTSVLRNLSCTIQEGDFIVIVGANGSGKSTFFDTIAGTIKPITGHIMLENTEITNLDEKHRALYISRLFQNTVKNSVGSLTVAQNLALATYKNRSVGLVNGMKHLSLDQAKKILEPLNGDVKKLLDKKMQSLSGGQRQLISFIMATLIPPKILLLDEPTAALDPTAATILLKYAAPYVKKHNITTLLITHDPHIALSIGNKVWVLEQGNITKQFTGEEKKQLNPDKLIGQIDYQALAETA